MMRSTRQESVLTNARRSRGPCARSCSSSVIDVCGEPLERCDIVFLQVIEERRQANLTRHAVADDAAGSEVPDGRGRVGCGQHDDGRALVGTGRDVWPEAARPRLVAPIFRERRGYPAARGDADLVDVIEPAELSVHGRHRWRAELEPPRVLMQLQGPRVERELIPVTEPPGDGWREATRELRPHVQEDHAR